MNHIREGMAVPEFSVQDPDGATVASADLEASCYVMFFFNTWCPSCGSKMDAMQGLWNAFRNDGRVAFLAIARDERGETPEKVAGYWSANGLDMPWYFGPGKSAFLKFANNTVPRLYIADGGRIVRYFRIDTGIADAPHLETVVRGLLE